MNLLLDTNILLAIIRDKTSNRVIKYINPNNNLVFVSIATVGEIESIAFQNNWQEKRIRHYEKFMENIGVLEINSQLIESYKNIDSYSQKKHPDFKTYPFKSSRNMGKNDIWIAATASFLNLSLVTTDKDFEHLRDTFISLNYIRASELIDLLK